MTPEVTVGSVWASKDECEVVIVTGLEKHGFAVSAFGWVSYGCEGSTNYDSIGGFLHDYPKLIFKVKDQK